MAGSGTAHLRDRDDVLLRVEDLVVEYPSARRQKVHAVSGVSLDILAGETLGLVGESGCGKSTVARAIIQLPPPTAGSVIFSGAELTSLGARGMKEQRRKLQIVFQDAVASLNPRRRVHDIVGEGLTIASVPEDESSRRVEEVLEAVGLDPAMVAGRRPSEFSVGQCQRISIARALVLDPDLLICDEPVASLDVSVQAQILNLIQDMRERYRLTLLFISHDLAVVKYISDRVAVMYLGKVCEVGEADRVYERPLHPYTRALVDAALDPDPDAGRIGAGELEGDLPSPVHPPSGCRFRTRCPRASQRCADEEPTVVELEPGRFVACHHPLVDEHPDLASCEGLEVVQCP
jgi:peptide/nickel transport system ATP-binding protein